MGICTISCVLFVECENCLDFRLFLVVWEIIIIIVVLIVYVSIVFFTKSANSCSPILNFVWFVLYHS